MIKQLPNISDDKGFVQESKTYAKRVLERIKVVDIEDALSKAFLFGAQRSIQIGYLLGEKDSEETIRYYKKQVEEMRREEQGMAE